MGHLLKIPAELVHAHRNAIAIRDAALETDTIAAFIEADRHVIETRRAIDRWRALQESRVLVGFSEYRA